LRRRRTLPDLPDQHRVQLLDVPEVATPDAAETNVPTRPADGRWVRSSLTARRPLSRSGDRAQDAIRRRTSAQAGCRNRSRVATAFGHTRAAAGVSPVAQVRVAEASKRHRLQA